MKEITVLLADDHNVVRQGLRALLSPEPDIQIVAEAENGLEAVRWARKTQPAVVVMDLAMPLLNGLEATRQIHQELPQTKVLVLTSYGQEDYVKQMIEAGAAGYLLKQTAANDLIRAIHEVDRGNAFFSPDIARRLCEQTREALGRRGAGSGSRELTPREAQVLQLIAEGFANKQMAAQLNISVKTVEKHRQQLMKKLNIHHTAGLTRYAAERGIVGEPAKPLLSSASESAPPAPENS